MIQSQIFREWLRKHIHTDRRRGGRLRQQMPAKIARCSAFKLQSLAVELSDDDLLKHLMIGIGKDHPHRSAGSGWKADDQRFSLRTHLGNRVHHLGGTGHSGLPYPP